MPKKYEIARICVTNFCDLIHNDVKQIFRLLYASYEQIE